MTEHRSATEHRNALGQPIGAPLPGWTPRPRPPRTPMEGRFCRLEPIDAARHTDELFAAFAESKDGAIWTYLAYGPFAAKDELRALLASREGVEDPIMYAIRDKALDRALGVATHMRIDPPAGVIEVGGITYGPALQRTPVSTEAMFLMMRRAFDELGYRRYEWKCDALNAPSRAAAQRLGFRFEGIFRQATVYKGRNRDTAWFSIIDGEWPPLRDAFERWLDPANFDAQGRQRVSLSSLTASLAAPR
jgi:RimJ/RimL family protein N-acetyltransferase